MSNDPSHDPRSDPLRGGLQVWWVLPVALLVALAFLLEGRRPDLSGVDAPVLDTAGFPRDVALPQGGALHLARPPARVVPASAGTVDLACALIPPERIAGLPRQALDYSGLREPDSPFLARPQFEVYAAEPILSLAPDLVVADRWQAGETTARLREAGVPVLELSALESLPDVEAALELLGRVLGLEQRAAEVAAGLRARADALAERGPLASPPAVLSYSNGGTGGWVAGAGTAADAWITMAGFVNAASAAGYEGHRRCSFEELIRLDPDVLVVAGRGSWDDLGGTAAVLRREPALTDLAAVRDERIVVLDAWLYSTVGPNLVTAAEALVAAVDALDGAAR